MTSRSSAYWTREQPGARDQFKNRDNKLLTNVAGRVVGRMHASSDPLDPRGTIVQSQDVTTLLLSLVQASIAGSWVGLQPDPRFATVAVSVAQATATSGLVPLAFASSASASFLTPFRADFLPHGICSPSAPSP